MTDSIEVPDESETPGSEVQAAAIRSASTHGVRGPCVWWLVWDAAQWGMGRLPVGKTLQFSSHDGESGRWRSVPDNFRAIAVGDRALGYQKGVGVVAQLSVVGKQPATIGSVPDTEGFVLVFRKDAQVSPVPIATVKQNPRMAESQPVRMNCLGSLFALSPDECAAMAELIANAPSGEVRSGVSTVRASGPQPSGVQDTVSRTEEPQLQTLTAAATARRGPHDAEQTRSATARKKRTGDIPEMSSSKLGEVAAIFVAETLEREVKLDRFRLDHYSDTLKLAIEYDGPEHYSEVTHVERDGRKDELCRQRQITLKRWPYYLQLTRDVAKWFWGEYYTDDKFARALVEVFHVDDETQMLAHGLHTSNRTPANYVERGRLRFLRELDEMPPSVRCQVVRSFQLYIERLGPGREWLLLPERDNRFTQLMQHAPRPEHLNCMFPALRRPRSATESGPSACSR